MNAPLYLMMLVALFYLAKRRGIVFRRTTKIVIGVLLGFGILCKLALLN